MIIDSTNRIRSRVTPWGLCLRQMFANYDDYDISFRNQAESSFNFFESRANDRCS